MSPLTIFWVAALVVFLVLEMITVSLVSLWFVGGALIAFLVSFVTGAFWVQVVVFLLVSVALLLLLRPLAKRFSVKEKDRITTGAAGLVGKRALVTEDIDNLRARGAVQVNGQYWSAKTEQDGVLIPKETVVRIRAVDGVRLVVEKTQ